MVNPEYPNWPQLWPSAPLALTALPSNAARAGRSPAGQPDLASAFKTASAKYEVPREVLVGIGFAESHLDGHNGTPSQANGYGVMHLASNPSTRRCPRQAKLTGLPVASCPRTTASNILGAAAVLDSYADQAGLTDPAPISASGTA